VSVTTTTGPVGAVRVHPRIRSRRIEVRRDAGRRRLKRGVVALSVLVGLLVVAAAVRSPLLDVDHLRTQGAEHTSPQRITDAAGVHRGTAMVGLDTEAAERRVEALPWVGEATVTRTWPGSVTVTVEERVPVAAVAVGEARWAQVDGEGRVLELVDAAPAGLPLLDGVEGRVAEGESLPAEAGDALAVLGAVGEALPGGVAAVNPELDVTLGYGGVVRFGSTDDLDDKVVAVETVLARVDLACMALLDVRAPGAPALTRHQGCS
jgi:cell division protein FtsQ